MRPLPTAPLLVSRTSAMTGLLALAATALAACEPAKDAGESTDTDSYTGQAPGTMAGPTDDSGGFTGTIPGEWTETGDSGGLPGTSPGTYESGDTGTLPGTPPGGSGISTGTEPPDTGTP